MRTLGQYGEAFKVASFAIFVVFGCSYFFYAATEGPFGLYEKGRIEADEVVLTTKRDILLAKRKEAENRVLRMSDTYLDLDLLDEQARRILGYVRSDEIIIR